MYFLLKTGGTQLGAELSKFSFRNGIRSTTHKIDQLQVALWRSERLVFEFVYTKSFILARVVLPQIFKEQRRPGNFDTQT